MPIVRFDVLWPDATVSRCQSPSTVIRSFLAQGQVYSVGEFVKVAEQGLGRASERVQEKYGFACSAAADQLDLIKTKASCFRDDPAAAVQVLRMD